MLSFILILRIGEAKSFKIFIFFDRNLKIEFASPGGNLQKCAVNQVPAATRIGLIRSFAAPRNAEGEREHHHDTLNRLKQPTAPKTLPILSRTVS